jgi:hypothetical protein
MFRDFTFRISRVQLSVYGMLAMFKATYRRGRPNSHAELFLARRSLVFFSKLAPHLSPVFFRVFVFNRSPQRHLMGRRPMAFFSFLG